MEAVFCVPAIGQEGLLDQKIAGLRLWERLFHHAKKAGMRPVFIVGANSPVAGAIPEQFRVVNFGDLPCRTDLVVVVCGPSTLPTINCLKRLLETPLSEGEFLDLGNMVVFHPLKDCFELERAFGPGGLDTLKDFLSGCFRPRKTVCNRDELLRVATEKDRKDAERQLFRGLVKDTEGFMSRRVERPVSLLISKRLAETSITPNEITVVSTLIGLLGAFFISLGQGFWQVAGSFLFLLHSIVDGCDGEIARIKFQESRLGGVLDFWGDNLVHAAVFWAIGLEWARRTGSVHPLYLAAAAVAGTLISASIVYFSTMTKVKEGPLYTSVSSSNQKSGIVRVADFLSRRDFIYLVVLLAIFKHLDWFLVAASVGSLLFAGVLIYIKKARVAHRKVS